MTLKTIKINTKSKSYNIFLGSNILGNLRTFLRRENLRLNKSLLIIDKNIPMNFRKLLIKNFNKRNLFILYFVSNENNKDQRSIEKIHNTLFSKNFNRDDCIVSFGGGILGDVAGFAASTYKRGIKFINIPSTLLSQVDSSIGGKTGINNKFGKNLIGSFYQPDLVISDTKVLIYESSSINPDPASVQIEISASSYVIYYWDGYSLAEKIDTDSYSKALIQFKKFAKKLAKNLKRFS